MRRRITARLVNGILAAGVTVAFLAHALLGGVSAVTGYTSGLIWLVWVFAALAVAHIVASGVTSHEQLTDAERPPSVRKKRHLLLKWVTGGLLLVVACVHVLLPRETWSAIAVTVALAAVLAVHVCVGSKSLLKDLGIDRRYKMVFRVVVCTIAALAAGLVVVGGLGL